MYEYMAELKTRMQDLHGQPSSRISRLDNSISIQFKFIILPQKGNSLQKKRTLLKNTCDEEAQVETIRLIELWASSFIEVFQ